MLGKYSGFKAKLQQVATPTFMIHCTYDATGSDGWSYNARKPDQRFFSGDQNRKSHQIEL